MSESLIDTPEGGTGPIDSGEENQPESTWSYAEGVPGTGDAPEFFKADKYANITEQAKAYRELEKRFGSFTGAPEKYELSLSDEMTEKGVEIKDDDPLYQQALEFAKNSNMNQEGFNQLINLYAASKAYDQEQIDSFKKSEIESLGPRGMERIDNLVSWGKANLPDDLYSGFEMMPTSADAVKALEHIISMTRSAPIAPNEGQPSSGMVSSEELRAMQFEKDEFGNRRLQTDAEFRARFNKLSKQVWGDHDHNVVIGR